MHSVFAALSGVHVGLGGQLQTDTPLKRVSARVISKRELPTRYGVVKEEPVRRHTAFTDRPTRVAHNTNAPFGSWWSRLQSS